MQGCRLGAPTLPSRPSPPLSSGGWWAGRACQSAPRAETRRQAQLRPPRQHRRPCPRVRSRRRQLRPPRLSSAQTSVPQLPPAILRRQRRGRRPPLPPRLWVARPALPAAAARRLAPRPRARQADRAPAALEQRRRGWQLRRPEMPRRQGRCASWNRQAAALLVWWDVCLLNSRQLLPAKLCRAALPTHQLFCRPQHC